MRILYIGGTGEISFACIHESVRLGHDVAVFNRGNNNSGLPNEVRRITGDVRDDTAYAELAGENFDVICQFRLFTPDEIDRDIRAFSGHCAQYVFISSASAYSARARELPIRETTPLENPYWAYSRAKAEMEDRLTRQDKNLLPYTIVRPSHTYRAKMPTPLGGEVSRLLRGEPIVVHGDGESMWTITHASDFARPFARLLGHPGALGEAFHITHDTAWSWNAIFAAIGEALGVATVELVHVSSDTLVRYNPEWTGPLLGDKSTSAIFDNSKVKRVVGPYTCEIDPWAGMLRVAREHPPRAQAADDTDAMYDRIIREQRALGA